MMIINGAPATTVPADDRGLTYGDGVFRTLVAKQGEPQHWERQYAKLASDCAALDLPCPDAALLLNESRSAARGHALAAVKIIVTRGSGPRGYAPPNPCRPTRVVCASAHKVSPVPPVGVRVHICRLRLGQQPALAGIKHLNRLENVLARTEWRDPVIVEGLLLDRQEQVIGGTMSNLFIVEGDALLTPALNQCGVAGVTRDRVMALAAKMNRTCRIEALSLQRVLDANEVFFVNSLIGLWPVAHMAGRAWPAGLLSAALRRALDAEDALA